MDTIKIKLTGTSPLMMHSELLANPLHKQTKAHKEIASKRKKTEEDHVWLMESEWSASLYFDDQLGPYLPALNVESCIAEAGKIRRLGTAIKQAVQVLDDKIRLEYEGPRKLKAMWDSNKFTDVRGVGVTGKKIMRCRPIFLQWQALFEVAFMDDVISRDDLMQVIEEAGRRIGLGDYRPRFGRFTAQVA